MRYREIENPHPRGLVSERIHAADDILELDHGPGNFLEGGLVDLAKADDAFVGLDLDQNHVVARPGAAGGPVHLVELGGDRMGLDSFDFHGGSAGIRQAGFASF
jgi:hypothetical protein